VLNGPYPNTNSRLISPDIILPAINPGAGEELHLRFWHWFSFDTYDSGVVQVSEETSPGVWSAWADLSTSSPSSGVWTDAKVDISAYAGKKVRIGFLLEQGAFSGVGPGWYIDDVSVLVKQAKLLPYSDGFEGGIGDWGADNGNWEVGTPSAGPGNCHSGTQCAGTVLNGNYANTNSRLISPSLILPAINPGAGELNLRFWHWFSFDTYDAGVVQISEETSPGVWSAWTDLSTYSSSSGVWTYPKIDISAYAEKKVRIGFLLKQGAFSGVAAGWYIDDVEIKSSNLPPVIDSFTAVPTSGNKPLPVSFTCVAHDPDGTIAEYRWDFNGDGIIDQVTSTGSTNHTYTACGTYAATCTAVDNLGATKTSDPVTISVCVVPKPDIKANGSDGPITIKPADTLSVTISLDSGNGVGMNADWWIVAETSGGWYHLDLMCNCWKPSLFVTYLSPLYNLSPLEVLTMSGLPVGTYKFYFAVDMNMNGHLDMGQLYYDSVTVTVSTP
jgi:PKD repeat protein